MPLIYIQGLVDVPQFQHTCQKNDLDPKKVVFIFPGNAGHHHPGTSLFSIKSVSGLAHAAAQLGGIGYPVLSLPTTNMEKWSKDIPQKSIVDGAIADLYRAIGAGYSLMLPVRDPKGRTDYFDHGLKVTKGALEPNFWGWIQLTSNKPLANYYITALDDLSDFIELSDSAKQSSRLKQSAHSFYAAYLEGLAMSQDNPWLKPPIVRKTQRRPQPKPVEIRPIQSQLVVTQIMKKRRCLYHPPMKGCIHMKC